MAHASRLAPNPFRFRREFGRALREEVESVETRWPNSASGEQSVGRSRRRRCRGYQSLRYGHGGHDQRSRPFLREQLQILQAEPLRNARVNDTSAIHSLCGYELARDHECGVIRDLSAISDRTPGSSLVPERKASID